MIWTGLYGDRIECMLWQSKDVPLNKHIEEQPGEEKEEPTEEHSEDK